jgi:hypothetical protein
MDNFLYNPEEIDFEQVASHDEVLAFDWHSLEKLQEKITESIEESEDELSESDDEFFKSDNEIEVFEREFEKTEIDSQAVQEIGDEISKLKICMRHFNGPLKIAKKHFGN